MNNPNPKISIITASYNYADLIGETITSVINQTYDNWELIIVDDGSDDNSLEVIQKFCRENEKLKLLTHENNQNKGLSETLKLGCNEATGDYIAFLESDDLWSEHYLTEKVKLLGHFKDMDLVFSTVELFGDQEEQKKFDEYFQIQRFFLKNQEYPYDLFKYFLFMNLIPTFSCVMIKSDVIKKLDFNAPFQPHLDLFLWLQAAYDNKLYCLNLPLTKWRIHPNSLIGRTENIKRANNKIIRQTIKTVINNSQKHSSPIIKWILTQYYTAIMILLKITKGLIKKIIIKF